TLRTLSLAGELRSVARRAPLWLPDRPMPLVLRSGIVREGVRGGDPSVTYGFYGRGDLIGVELLFGSGLRTALEAYEDCVVVDLPLADLRRCLQQDLGLVSGLARWENHRVQALQSQLSVVAHGSAPQRLAATLRRLARRFGVRDSRGTIINLRLTHRELASLIGSTRETVSVTVTQMRDAGLIQVDAKRFVLIDRRAINRLADGDTR
ncbi:MAG: Crp/Fnr family transcriptional regulator, partial [Myxococcales bacterium]|nr:Crp/Fnr family transcriptional regulator [Myxococcales bacterium]